MNFRRRAPEEPDINIVSMIDVVLVLLLFFMITTSFTKQSALKLDLPQASPNAASPQEALTIDIDPVGRMALNGQPVSVSDLPERLRSLARQSGDGTVVLRADRNTTQQHVVAALDAARQAGLLRVSIATQSE